MIDDDRAIAVTKQGEFYFIDFTQKGQESADWDPEIKAILSSQKPESFNQDVKGVNFMGLKEKDEDLEIMPGFREIVVSECQRYMAFLFLTTDNQGLTKSRVEIWMTGDWNFMEQEIYKIQEFEIEGFCSILDFGMFLSHSQILTLGKGKRRVNGKLCYETIEFYSVNDGKLSGELPGIMMGMQPFTRNSNGDYLTTLFSDSGDDVALMIIRPNDLS